MIKNGKNFGHKKKLLAINFGGIGDEILFLPTLKTIRGNCPDWSITLLVEPRSRSVQELTDLIDTTLTFDIKKRPLMVGDLLDVLSLIKSGEFDAIVSSGSSLMVAGLLFLSGVRERVGYGTTSLGSMLLTQPVPLHKNQYAANMYHDLAVGFLKQQGLAPFVVPQQDQLIPEVILKNESLERMSAFLSEHGLLSKTDANKTIVLHPGTSRLATEKGIIKTWDSWVELINLVGEYNARPDSGNFTIVLAGGPDDKEIIENIQAQIGSAPHVVSANGKTKNISDLAALIHLSDLMLCVDSAPMHVAVGLRKPLVALFGPTNPALLLPKLPQFTPVWDSRDGNRHMFDRLGLKIDPKQVFVSVLETFSGANQNA